MLRLFMFCVLQNLDDWTFDVFALNEAGENHALKYVGYELLQRYDIINKFKVSAAGYQLDDSTSAAALYFMINLLCSELF